MRNLRERRRATVDPRSIAQRSPKIDVVAAPVDAYVKPELEHVESEAQVRARQSLRPMGPIGGMMSIRSAPRGVQMSPVVQNVQAEQATDWGQVARAVTAFAGHALQTADNVAQDNVEQWSIQADMMRANGHTDEEILESAPTGMLAAGYVQKAYDKIDARHTFRENTEPLIESFIYSNFMEMDDKSLYQGAAGIIAENTAGLTATAKIEYTKQAQPVIEQLISRAGDVRRKRGVADILRKVADNGVHSYLEHVKNFGEEDGIKLWKDAMDEQMLTMKTLGGDPQEFTEAVVGVFEKAIKEDPNMFMNKRAATAWIDQPDKHGISIGTAKPQLKEQLEDAYSDALWEHKKALIREKGEQATEQAFTYVKPNMSVSEAETAMDKLINDTSIPFRYKTGAISGLKGIIGLADRGTQEGHDDFQDRVNSGNPDHWNDDSWLKEGRARGIYTQAHENKFYTLRNQYGIKAVTEGTNLIKKEFPKLAPAVEIAATYGGVKDVNAEARTFAMNAFHEILEDKRESNGGQALNREQVLKAANEALEYGQNKVDPTVDYDNDEALFTANPSDAQARLAFKDRYPNSTQEDYVTAVTAYNKVIQERYEAQQAEEAKAQQEAEAKVVQEEPKEEWKSYPERMAEASNAPSTEGQDHIEIDPEHPLVKFISERAGNMNFLEAFGNDMSDLMERMRAYSDKNLETYDNPRGWEGLANK